MVESSFSSSVETSLLNVSEYQDPFAACDWAMLAETYQMIHKFPKQSPSNISDIVLVPDATILDEPKHQKLRESSPEKSVMHKVSKNALPSLVFSRRKKSVKLGGTAELNLGRNKKQDDSFVPGESTKEHKCPDSVVSVHNTGESTKAKTRFNNCLVYRRRKRIEKSSCNFTGETTIRGDGLDDDFVTDHDCGETKRRGKQLNNCLVYSRKKVKVKFNSCSFSEHLSGGTKISCDQAASSADSQRGLIVKADGDSTGPNAGEIKNSGHQRVHNEGKQLLKSNGCFTESRIGETKRNGDRSNVLLVYKRRKKKEKSISAQVNGFLVYSRKKPKVKSTSTFTGRDPTLTKKLELVDETNDSCSSLKSSSESASSSSKSREDGATDCNSSDAGASETDTDSSSSPFRQCKRCDKPGTAEKMLICDECEESYHTRCCGVLMKEIADIDDWICPSCLKKKSSKGRNARKGKSRVTEPFIIGIRIGKEFQADVPDWSGPTMSGTTFVGERLEIDESEFMHDLKKAKNSKKPCSPVKWLQCREEDVNGDICGKWRRAPRSEVQTKDWECFCCVFWDPSRADCAVPQEVETSEILSQIKYHNMLRPRPDAKRRKLGP